MSETNTFARSLHDVGLAAWFGGTLFGSAALNPATAELDTAADRIRAADSSWGRWTPINAAAIGAHLLGGALVTFGNKGRIGAQKGVGTATVVKSALTAGALAATAYSRKLGQEVMDWEAQQRSAGNAPDAADATTPSAQTPPHVAEAQANLKKLQWAIPALTGGLLVLNVFMGEQQRPSQVAKGFAKRLVG
jgi:hypothetical protein